MSRAFLVSPVRAVLSWAVLTCIGATIAPLAAQSAPDLASVPAARPAFGLTTQVLREIRTGDSIAAVRTNALRRATSIPDDDSPGRRRLWPYFTLGGAVGGGVFVIGLALTHCDANCRDDGALAFAAPYVAVGAAAGAAVGTLIGLIVDSARSDSP